MMDALWERKQAVDRVAAKQLNVTITALANFGVNNETVACETLTVVRKNTPLDATPSIHLSTSIDFATISRLVQHSHKWRSWYDHALTFPVPERYNANSLSRRQVELNRQAIETTDPYPLPSEETLCYAFSFLPLMYRRRLMCVSRGFHIAALKTDFARWSDSHRGSARDGENGLSTSRRTYLRLSPIIEGGIINVLEMSFEVPEPPPRGESYYMNFVFGMIRVEVSDAENKPYVGRPPGEIAESSRPGAQKGAGVEAGAEAEVEAEVEAGEKTGKEVGEKTGKEVGEGATAAGEPGRISRAGLLADLEDSRPNFYHAGPIRPRSVQAITSSRADENVPNTEAASAVVAGVETTGKTEDVDAGDTSTGNVENAGGNDGGPQMGGDGVVPTGDGGEVSALTFVPSPTCVLGTCKQPIVATLYSLRFTQLTLNSLFSSPTMRHMRHNAPQCATDKRRRQRRRRRGPKAAARPRAELRLHSTPETQRHQTDGRVRRVQAR